ncbi:serine/threonine-protein kinase [Microcoleus sp. FACHB-68]|uniref:serine/threonine-protein kinase n=1 Tax=Microcoleus sp. FACHB-68 TaxID=2692826 RepID=UPI001689B640|nr:serine/threonine-protein kinase [Microcoleus sp. FACHB-68]MBD1939030.1 serine/threonine protein kinase [Microcoleus sp. FACHB-68]
MEILCTRTGCPRPVNSFADLDDSNILKTVQQKFCTSCGMPLILIGRYLPVKLLGKGGFGAAFLARDRYTPAMRQCVVKQFQPAGDLTPQQMQIAQGLFEREAVVLEELGNRHPQIPDLFAFFPLEVPGLQPGKPDQFFYLVQEFIDGQNLEEELAQKGQFSEAEILEVLGEILKVLKFVHEHHSIHRDIKPANIMRARNGRLFLLDFGAVKQVAQAAGGDPGHQRSTGIYSMGFAPPEQMAGSTVFPSTDLYALAVTCITLLTGKSAMELFDSYSNELNWRGYARVSDHLATILDRMLLSAPSRRFQSADEVIAALSPQQPQPAPSLNPPPSMPPTSLPTQITAPRPAPATPPAQQSPPAPLQRPTKPSFSTFELLGGAAFTGFQGALLAIAISSALGISGVSYLIWLGILASVIFAQARRVIEGKDLPIIAIVTLAIVLGVSQLQGGFGLQGVVAIAALAGLSAVALTALFRLIYKLLSSIF